jgi:hypothetical protein
MDLNVWSNIEESPRNLSPIGIIMDSDTDDGTSVASTPVHATPRQSMPLRRSASTNALDASSSNGAEGLDATRPPDSLLSLESQGGSNSFSFKCEAIDDDEEVSLDLELGPSPPPIVGSSQVNPRSFSDAHFLPVKQAVSPDHRSETESIHRSRRASSSPHNGGRPSRWSLSPISRVKSVTPRSSMNRPFLQKRTDSFYKRRIALDASSVSVHSDDDHRPNGPSNELSDGDQKPGDVRLEFEAPRKGQLGLVIEARPQVGPTVHAIKDYSPLFGRVKRGDKIVEVDGKNTTHSNLTEITKLLAVRPGRRGSNLRIVITRPHHAQPVQPIPVKKVSLQRHHSRNSSYGSGVSIPESQEALDVEERSVPQPPMDDLLRHSQADKVDFKRDDLVRNVPHHNRNFSKADKVDFKSDDLPRPSHRAVRNSHQAHSVEFKRDVLLRKQHHARNSHQADVGDFRRNDFLRNPSSPERNSFQADFKREAQADFKRDDLTRNFYHADKGDFEGEL